MPDEAPLLTAAEFVPELEAAVPPELPHREEVIAGTARHLELVVAANTYMNLTRIVSPREAAVKHVADSVIPWKLLEPFKTVMDLGSGAGFPGIPLAYVFPEKKLLLVESVGKKAEFLRNSVETLGLRNVSVRPERAEEILRELQVDAVVVRAVAQVPKLLHLLRPVIRQTGVLFLYKGPDMDQEMAEGLVEERRARVRGAIEFRYQLPYDSGARSIVVYRKN